MIVALATIWALIKLLLILSTAAAMILIIILVFHPVSFNVQLRASKIGQRGELWCNYLFGIFKIGVIASPHNQDVVLKFLYWKKLLQRNGRQKPDKPHKPAGPGDTASPTQPSSSPEQNHDTRDVSKVSAEIPTSTHVESPLPTQVTPETQILDTKKEVEKVEEVKKAEEVKKTEEAKKAEEAKKVKETEIIEKAEVSHEPDIAQKPSLPSLNDQGKKADDTRHAASNDGLRVNEPEDITPEPVPQPVTAADTSPLKPLQQVESEQKAEEKAKSAEQSQATAKASGSTDTATKDTWRARMRRFKRDLTNRYRKLQSHIKLAMRKWKILSPILKRFWNRGKKGFSISSPALMVRYALHEPYLTGMFHGTMSVLSGLASRFGINFVPVPVFTGPSIYARGCATAVIRPWRFLSAALGLLLEKQLYQEAWSAFKWYKANKRTA